MQVRKPYASRPLQDVARLEGVAMIRVFLAYALSGFVALGYQVVWFRIFPDWFGSTSLSFALVVCNFIGGLGAGSLASRPITTWLARVVDRSEERRVGKE